tara:strand:- start:2135 stop:2512 length:378 start_codon:yes stop_codon:yes gene_type:complete
MKAYKAVRRMAGDWLRSLIIMPGAEIRYIPGEKTLPEFGEIFVFEHLLDAVEFVEGRPHSEIWEVECPDLTHREFIATGQARDYKLWWEQAFSNPDWVYDGVGLEWYAPEGTSTTSWVILKEKVG